MPHSSLYTVLATSNITPSLRVHHTSVKHEEAQTQSIHEVPVSHIDLIPSVPDLNPHLRLFILPGVALLHRPCVAKWKL